MLVIMVIVVLIVILVVMVATSLTAVLVSRIMDCDLFGVLYGRMPSEAWQTLFHHTTTQK